MGYLGDMSLILPELALWASKKYFTPWIIKKWIKDHFTKNPLTFDAPYIIFIHIT